MVSIKYIRLEQKKIFSKFKFKIRFNAYIILNLIPEYLNLYLCNQIKDRLSMQLKLETTKLHKKITRIINNPVFLVRIKKITMVISDNYSLGVKIIDFDQKDHVG